MRLQHHENLNYEPKHWFTIILQSQSILIYLINGYMFSTVPTWVRLKSPGLGNAEGSGEEGRNARAHDGRRNSAGDSRTSPCLPDTAGCNRPFHTILRSIMMFYKVFMKTHSSEKYFNTLPLKNLRNDKDEKFLCLNTDV